MKHRFLMIAVMLLILPFAAQAIRVFKVSTRRPETKTEVLKPSVEIIKTENGYLLSFEMKEFEIEEDDLYPKKYQVRLPGFGNNETPTQAGVLYRGYDMVFPYGRKPTVKMLSCDSVTCTFPVAPARPDLIDNDTIGYTLDNVPPISSNMEETTLGPVFVQSVGTYRGNGIVRVGVCPIKWDYITQKSTIYNKFTCEISLGDEIFEAPSLDLINWNNRFDNPALQFEGGDLEIVSPVPLNDARDLLILTPYEFESHLTEFIDWKRKEGYKTYILNCEQDDNPTYIRHAIIDFAKTHPDLYAILICGNIERVPSWPSDPNTDLGKPYYSDINYACLEKIFSEDAYPDVLIGRIPCEDSYELNNALSKILDYEKANTFKNRMFVDNTRTSLHLSQFIGTELHPDIELDNFIKGSEEIRDSLINIGYTVNRLYKANEGVSPKYYHEGDELPNDLLYPNYDWNINESDVINAWKNELYYVLYRGHGSIKNWSMSKALNVADLQKSTFFPPVFSIACLTGYMQDRSLAADLLTAESAGASGVLAATQASLSKHNDTLAKSMFKTMFPISDTNDHFYISYRPWLTVGESVYAGLSYMRNTTIPANRNDYHFQIYHWFGDPTMRLFNDTPKHIRSLGFSFVGNYLKATAPGSDVQITAVYLSGEVISYRSNEVKFPGVGLESVTFIGKNIIPRTFTIDDISIDNTPGRYDCTLDYALYRQGIIEVHYKVPISYSWGGVTPNNYNASIIVTDQNGNQFWNEKCITGSGVMTIPVSACGISQIYNVTMVNNGEVVGSTKIYVK